VARTVGNNSLDRQGIKRVAIWQALNEIHSKKKYPIDAFILGNELYNGQKSLVDILGDRRKKSAINCNLS